MRAVIALSVEVSHLHLSDSHMEGLAAHIQAAAESARDSYIDGAVEPGGCFCSGMQHLASCHNHVIPF